MGPAVRRLRWLVAALSCVVVGWFLATAATTLAYPWQLEWMEGGTVDVAARVLRGASIYTAPSIEYVPYRYTPLYYLVVAAWSRVFGLSLLSARFVSLAAYLGSALLLSAFVRYEGGDEVSALAAVAMYTGTYYKVLQWFHHARNDSLLVCLWLGAFYALRTGVASASAVLAGLLLWLAFLTKQSTLMVLAAATPFLWWWDRRRTLIAVGIALGAIGATSLVMEAVTDGWWRFFVFTLPATHGYTWSVLWPFIRYDVLRWVLPASGLVAAVLVTLSRERPRLAWFHAGLLAGAVAIGLGSRMGSASSNVLMPMYAAVGLVAALSVPTTRLSTGRTLAWAGVVLQLFVVIQASVSLIREGAWPSATLTANADQFVSFLRDVPGPVLNWDQRFIVTRAGKPSLGLEAAADELAGAVDTEPGIRLRHDILEACRSGRFVGVVDPPEWLLDRVAHGAPVVFTPAGWWKIEAVYYPIDSPDDPAWQSIPPAP